jgi:TPR repeat protein
MRAYRSFVAILTSLALALQAPLSALAAGADLASTNTPATGDDIARRCDVFSSAYDFQYSGPRTALDDATVAEALSVCAQAADVRPARPRYVYLYGTALLAAKRYTEAAGIFTWVQLAGNPWGADSLAWLASQGWGEPQNNEKAAQLFREAGNGGLAVADYGLASLYENGDGVPLDADEAMRLYRRAADGGITSA